MTLRSFHHSGHVAAVLERPSQKRFLKIKHREARRSAGSHSSKRSGVELASFLVGRITIAKEGSLMARWTQDRRANVRSRYQLPDCRCKCLLLHLGVWGFLLLDDSRVTLTGGGLHQQPAAYNTQQQKQQYKNTLLLLLEASCGFLFLNTVGSWAYTHYTTARAAI